MANYLRAVPAPPAVEPLDTMILIITEVARIYYRRAFPNGTPYDHLDDEVRNEIDQYVTPFVHDTMHAIDKITGGRQ